MYGLVNRALEDLIRTQHDDATWERIRLRADLGVDIFLSLQTYPDEVTVALVAAAAAELGRAPQDLLEAFGRHWVKYATHHGYRDLMQARGESVLKFMARLDELHSRLSLTFPELRPPSFRVENLDSRSIRLHYVSERDGLSPFVVGLLHGLGELFASPVSVEHVGRKGDGSAHDQFVVRLLASEGTT